MQEERSLQCGYGNKRNYRNLVVEEANNIVSNKSEITYIFFFLSCQNDVLKNEVIHDKYLKFRVNINYFV